MTPKRVLQKETFPPKPWRKRLCGNKTIVKRATLVATCFISLCTIFQVLQWNLPFNSILLMPWNLLMWLQWNCLSQWLQWLQCRKSDRYRETEYGRQKLGIRQRKAEESCQSTLWRQSSTILRHRNLFKNLLNNHLLKMVVCVIWYVCPTAQLIIIPRPE